MTVPIIIILVSIFRTCLITINLRKRFRTSIPHNQQQESQQPLTDMPTAVKLETLGQCTSTTTTSRISYSFVSSHSSTA
ncbi:unnamed protein product, partial [Rotaria magnacalcarata]